QRDAKRDHEDCRERPVVPLGLLRRVGRAGRCPRRRRQRQREVEGDQRGGKTTAHGRDLRSMTTARLPSDTAVERTDPLDSPPQTVSALTGADAALPYLLES